MSLCKCSNCFSNYNNINDLNNFEATMVQIRGNQGLYQNYAVKKELSRYLSTILKLPTDNLLSRISRTRNIIRR